jgi:hypothetical protein
LHAVIVAGPSGAGKTTFMSELRAGRLALNIRQHLPRGAEDWPQLRGIPKHWEPFLADPHLARRTAGIIVHYDVTSRWRELKREFARDTLWQLLYRCEGVTLVLVQPPIHRLLSQWSRHRLGMRPWRVHVRKKLGWSASFLLAGVRWLRTAKHLKDPQRMRYPRPVRFLKHVDRGLRGYRRHSTGHFDFYRGPGNVDQMLRSWNEVVTAKTAALPLTRIHLVPDPATKIGRTFGWQVTALDLAPTAAPAPQRSGELT